MNRDTTQQSLASGWTVGVFEGLVAVLLVMGNGPEVGMWAGPCVQDP